ncbi:isocitrate lyase family-domain-containing protein [Mycena maculata]|uniref:methylisocitrate lyase n=1 Tax=Mycena maculata TaxID=230809 RepID=A0AAD7MIF7_9AGAR|nr:isocitrate lyase family-domain-containing protein [Mycena maculata]
MKLAKIFVEAGSAAVHLDDQVPGTKKTGAKTAARVLVPVSELVARLLALKSQRGVMGSECLIIQRTDGVHHLHHRRARPVLHPRLHEPHAPRLPMRPGLPQQWSWTSRSTRRK